MASLPLALALLAIAFPIHTVSAAKGFSIELIHRDSPRSPLYDPSATPFDRAAAAAHRSAARARHISASLAATGSQTIVAGLSPDAFEYIMELKLGTPPTTVVAIVDSGSDLIWTNCKPCDRCFSQLPPLFDPEMSSTFQTVFCGSDTCALLSQTCEEDSTCTYHNRYADTSVVDGFLAADSATFDLSSGEKVIVGLAFGCNSQSSGIFSNKISGLVGLGAAPLSLVSQISSSFEKKFSHCMAAHSSAASSKISFGSEAVVSGENVVSTPMTITMGLFYTLNLEEIIVAGGIPIDVTRVTPIRNGVGNIIIDSGTTLTELDAGVLDELVQSLKAVVNYYPSVPDPTNFGHPLCFDISKASLDKPGLPSITFKFEGPAEVVLQPLNWLIRVNINTVCMMVSPARTSTQIFGNFAQQNFKVGYDLVAKKVSFAPADCIPR